MIIMIKITTVLTVLGKLVDQLLLSYNVLQRCHYFVALSGFKSEDFFLPANSGQIRQLCILIQNSELFNLLWVKVVADKYL